MVNLNKKSFFLNEKPSFLCFSPYSTLNCWICSNVAHYSYFSWKSKPRAISTKYIYPCLFESCFFFLCAVFVFFNKNALKFGWVPVQCAFSCVRLYSVQSAVCTHKLEPQNEIRFAYSTTQAQLWKRLTLSMV